MLRGGQQLDAENEEGQEIEPTVKGFGIKVLMFALQNFSAKWMHHEEDEGDREEGKIGAFVDNKFMILPFEIGVLRKKF